MKPEHKSLSPQEFEKKLLTVNRFWNDEANRGDSHNHAPKHIKKQAAYIFVRNDGWSIAGRVYGQVYDLWAGDWKEIYELEENAAPKPEKKHGTGVSVFVTEIEVEDPDTGAMVAIEIHKDQVSGGMFGIDSSFLEQTHPVIRNPFNPDQHIHLSDSDKTKVIFKFISGDVIALFPEQEADENGNIMSYMHVGQHGAASPNLVTELENVTHPAAYKDLKEELEGLGYNLEVLNKHE